MTAVASSEQPEVSIIVPTRDRHDRLPRTLLTALGQRDVDVELIVVDDGSRQPVAEQLTEAAKKRVRVIRHESPLGVASARNAGIEAARGAWIALLDDDDLWAPTKLRRQLDAAAAAGLEFAFSEVLAVSPEGRVIYVAPVPDSATDLRPAILARNSLPAGSSNLIVRTSLMRRVGGFDPAFSVLADWDLNARLAATGAPATVPERLVGYVLHDSNMHSAEAGLADELERFGRKHAEERARHGVTLDVPWWLVGRAVTRRRAGDRRGEAAVLLELARVTRRPRLVVRPVLLGIHAEWMASAIRRFRQGRTEAHEEAAPPWVLQSLDPSQDDLRAIWREP